MPRSAELLRDIHETNLMYLLLLQRMARAGNLPALAGMQMSVQAASGWPPWGRKTWPACPDAAWCSPS
ncbi:hypothetical protein WJ973_21185 [Achromobacter xylosoxidans]